MGNIILVFLFFASSRNSLIPKNICEDPLIEKLTRSVANQYWGVNLFSISAGIWFGDNTYTIDNQQYTERVGVCVDPNWSRLIWLKTEGEGIESYGEYGSGVDQFSSPWGIDGKLPDIFITDRNNNRLVHLRFNYDEVGRIIGLSHIKFITGIPHPQDVSYFDNKTSETSDDLIYAISGGRIYKFSYAGSLIATFGRVGTEELEFLDLTGIDVVKIGSKISIYVVDYLTKRIARLIDSNSVIVDYKEKKFNEDYGIVSLSCDFFGFIYVADCKKDCVTKISPDFSQILWSYGNHGTGTGKFDFLHYVKVLGDMLAATEKWAESSGISTYWITDLHPFDTIPPVAQLHSPPNKTYVNHIIKIVGTVTDETWLNDWQIYYAQGINPSEGWILIGFGTSEKYEDALTEWNTYELEQGIYTLRLLVHDASGNCRADTVIVYVGEPPLELVIGKQGQGDGELRLPTDVSIDTAGLIYISDTQNDRIQVFDGSGNYLFKWGIHGKGDGEFMQPVFSAIAQDKIYIADTYNDRFQVFSLLGNYLNSIGKKGHGPGDFNQTSGIDFYGDCLFLGDIHHHQVHKYTKNGAYSSSFGEYGSEPGQLNQPQGIAIIDTFIYVVDRQNNRVQKFTISGLLKKVIGAEGSEDGQFSHPYDIVVDSDFCFYVTDYHNNRFQKFDKYGYRLLTVYSKSDSLKMPSGISIDKFMNTYICDTHKDRVLKFPQRLFIEAGPIKTPPKNATLLPCYPNPSSRVIMIQYGVPQKGKSYAQSGGTNIYSSQEQSIERHRVILKVYDLLGRLVKTLVDEEKIPGWYRAVWDGEDNIGRKVPSGVYFIRLQIETELKNQKIVIVK